MHVQHSSERLRASTKRGRGAQPPKKFVDLDGEGGCGIKDKHKCLTGEYTGIKFDIVRHYLCIIEQNIVRYVVRYVVRTHRAMCRKITLENPDNVGCSTTLGDHI